MSTSDKKQRRLSVLLTPQTHTLLAKLRAVLDAQADDLHTVTDTINHIIIEQAKASGIK